MQCGPLIKAIDAYLRKADSDLTEILGEEGYTAPEETVEVISAMEESVTEALTRETEYIVAEAEKADTLEEFASDIWPEVKENDALQDTLHATFRERFSEIVPKFAGYYLSDLENGLEIGQISNRTTAWIESWSEELAEIMQLNSHKGIETILTRGLEEGAGIAEFTRKIMENGIRDEWYKARRVSVTEVLTAHRAAQQEAFMQSPATTEKMWRHTGIYIHGPRQNHKDMDGRKVPKNQPFELLGADGVYYHPMYPGDTSLPPGERIECHCTTQGIVDEGILGLPLEERQRLQQEAIDELDDRWLKELEDKNKALVGFTDAGTAAGDTPLTSPPSASTINREGLISSIKGKFDVQLTEPQRSEFGDILEGMSDDQLLLYNKMSQNHAENLYHFTESGAAYYPSTQRVKMDIDKPSWERAAGTGQTAAWHTKFHEECHQLDHILAKMGIDFEDLDGGSITASAITNTSTPTGKKLLKAIEDDIISLINRTVDERNAARLEMDLDPSIKTITSLGKIPKDTKDSLIYWLRDHYQTPKARAQIDMLTDAIGLVTRDHIPLYQSGFWGHMPQYNKDRDGNGATSETFATFGSLFFSGDEETRAVVQELMPSTWQAYSDLFAKIMQLAQGRDILYP